MRKCPAVALFWLPPLVNGGLVALVYNAAANAERGSRAGAEPVLAGVLVALPFVPLVILQSAAALAAVLSRSWAAGAWCLGVMSLLAIGVAGLVLVVTMSGAGLSRGAALLMVGLVLPLVPAWIAHLGASARPVRSSRAR